MAKKKKKTSLTVSSFSLDRLSVQRDRRRAALSSLDRLSPLSLALSYNAGSTKGRRGKRLKLKRKRVEDDLVDMKSERKHVETGKRLKSECERLKSARKQLKRKDDRVPDRAYLRLDLAWMI
ncbi:hypothetical protein P8452_42731 [Trifolium repens]|nr:hypothetical protein P8452_42731 [Trifolium repens]